MAQSTTNLNNWLRPNRSGQFVQIDDAAANDSDKTITVTAGKVWHVLYAFASLASTATVGNRQIQMDVGDGTNVIGQSSALNVQVASLTENYHWRPDRNTATEDVATEHYMPLPSDWLPAGYTMRFYDSAAIDAAADDLTVRIIALEYDAD